MWLREYGKPGGAFDTYFGFNAACLTEAVKVARAKGYQVVLMRCPENTYIIGDALDRFKEKYTALMDKLVAEQGAHAVNPNAKAGLVNADFRDLYHLIGQGRTKWQRALADGLAPVLIDHFGPSRARRPRRRSRSPTPDRRRPARQDRPRGRRQTRPSTSPACSTWSRRSSPQHSASGAGSAPTQPATGAGDQATAYGQGDHRLRCGAEGGNRTHTPRERDRILSPARLPVPPLRHRGAASRRRAVARVAAQRGAHRTPCSDRDRKDADSRAASMPRR